MIACVYIPGTVKLLDRYKMDDDLIVRRFAIKYNPPTLVVEYKIGSSLFLKKIKIKTCNVSVSVLF